MCEALCLNAPSILLNDKHHHLINLARCVKARRRELEATLDAQVFAPDTLAEAKALCRRHEPDPGNPLFGDPGRPATADVDPETDEAIAWAAAYFYASWCQRNGVAGTDGEFGDGGPCYRYDDGGGDPVKRYRSAVRQLFHFEAVFSRAAFACGDGIDLVEKIVAGRKKQADKDKPTLAAIYADPPFPGPGDRYTHPFNRDQHARLARLLNDAPGDVCRVVCRYYDDELSRIGRATLDGVHHQQLLRPRHQRHRRRPRDRRHRSPGGPLTMPGNFTVDGSPFNGFAFWRHVAQPARAQRARFFAFAGDANLFGLHGPQRPGLLVVTGKLQAASFAGVASQLEELEALCTDGLAHTIAVSGASFDLCAGTGAPAVLGIPDLESEGGDDYIRCPVRVVFQRLSLGGIS